MNLTELSAEEKARYNRHIILPEIGEEGQLKIKQSKVLVVGAGGLGSPVLRYLTAAGVGTIGIVDDDVVDASNLQRQILYDTNELGRPKAEVAKEKLTALNPNSVFHISIARFLPENGLKLAEGYDMIVDCTDNYEARYTINEASKELGIPMVYGAIFKFEGQISVFNYEGGTSYDSVFPEPPPVNNAPDAKGLLGVLPGVIGTMQATEVLKIVLGLGDVLNGKLMVANLLKHTFTVLKLA